MELLHGAIQPYAWGSRAAIAAIQGREVPSATPEAELWLGAHPAAPSTVHGTSLAEVIAADPAATLGPAQRYGRLPYLLKLLAAEAPLSLQAHPDAAQAQAGYEAEQAAGVAPGAPNRNYKDPYHKPEMICAVTDFEALCGFRDPRESARILAGLNQRALRPVVNALDDGDLRQAVTGLLASSSTVDGAVAAAAKRVRKEPAYQLAVDLAARYPGDAGVLVALLLNRISLRPGQAMYAPAGYLHAYLRGVGVELMAASDNVLRGGLTPKHVDVPELLRVLRFQPGLPPMYDPQPAAPGVDTWPTLPGTTEFALSRARVGGPYPRIELPGTGPRILFCLTGRVLATDGAAPLTLPAGQAAFVPATAPAVALTGYGEIYQAQTAPPA